MIAVSKNSKITVAGRSHYWLIAGIPTQFGSALDVVDVLYRYPVADSIQPLTCSEYHDLGEGEELFSVPGEVCHGRA